MSRLLRLPALALCALALLTLGAARPANATVGPVITVKSYSPSPIPAAGGTEMVTATVTDGTAPLTNVVLQESRPGYGFPYRTAPMSVGSDGVTYTASIPVDINTNSGQNGEVLSIAATDSASNTTSANVATQEYSNAAPTITVKSYSPNPIPAAGATVTVTATVTDPALGLTSIVLQESRPGYGFPYRTAPMSVGSDGVTYTASIPVDLNTNSGQSGEVLYVFANDPAGNQNTVKVATQINANMAPTVTVKSVTPNPIPVGGGTVTVTATVTDPALGLTSVVLQESRPGYGFPYRTAPMSVGSDGVTYTASIPVDLNTNSGQDGEALSILATDPASNSTTTPVATQGYTNPPPSGSLPILATSNPANPVLNPPVAASGGSDLPLIITGGNFASGAKVLFNGVVLAPASVTANQISVTVPAPLIASPGSYAITVVSPAPGGFSNGVNLNVVAPAPAVPLYALNYQNTYFTLTYSPTQAASFMAAGWTGGTTGHVYANPYDAPGLTPLYRLYNPGTQDHFFTIDSSQRASLIASGAWQDKGVCCYVFSASVGGSIPLNTAYNTQTSQHLFTGNMATYNALPSPPWNKGGAAAYILP